MYSNTYALFVCRKDNQCQSKQDISDKNIILDTEKIITVDAW